MEHVESADVTSILKVAREQSIAILHGHSKDNAVAYCDYCNCSSKSFL